ncbi:MAG: hypothetical protein EXR80_00815 [Methylococcales bacterium]|nr:hypothetical protein [Methylococcales bacterium]
MIKFLFFISALWIINPAYAIDATNNITKNIQIGQWQVVEVAGSEKIMYRMSSNSINTPDTNIVFDFVPSKDCSSSVTATMIINLKSDYDTLNSGMVFFAYKLPNQKETIELVKTVMSEGDSFAFFPFEKVTVKTLLPSKEKGKLAIWVHPSGNGVVKKSGNIYFSLEGFSLAYKEAKSLCNDNR